jgi:hypothetical protein
MSLIRLELSYFSAITQNAEVLRKKLIAKRNLSWEMCAILAHTKLEIYLK